MQDEYGMFYKPIGYYDFGTTNEILEICLLNEFLEPFKQIRSKLDLDLSERAKTLNLLYNVFIALGSREVGNVVRSMFNSPKYSKAINSNNFQMQRLFINNIDVKVKTSMMGAIEAVFFR